MQIQELSLMETKVEIMKRHKLERSALDIANLIIEKKEEINSERMKVLLESLSYRQELNVKREMLKEAKARESILIGICPESKGTENLSYRKEGSKSDGR